MFGSLMLFQSLGGKLADNTWAKGGSLHGSRVTGRKRTGAPVNGYGGPILSIVLGNFA